MGVIPIFISILCFSIKSISSASYTCNVSSVCGCSTLSPVFTARIIGGNEAPNHLWGWMVSLQLLQTQRCGASLLTAEYAVTAAHCVYDYMDDFSKLSILVGTNYLDDTSSATQRRPIGDLFIHPDFNNKTLINDIAILYFTPLVVSSTSNLAFICLPEEYQDPFQVGTNLVAIGWGVTFKWSFQPSNSLLQVILRVYSSTLAACIASNITNSTVQFCAGVLAGGKDACDGDSGGPLMAYVSNRWILAGIASGGVGCGLAGRLGIYTRVSSFISFINSIINSTELRTTRVRTSTSPQNNLSNAKKNNENLIYKSITVLMFSFLISFFSCYE